MWLTSSTRRRFQYLQDSSQDMAQILSIALENLLKVLDSAE